MSRRKNPIPTPVSLVGLPLGAVALLPRMSLPSLAERCFRATLRDAFSLRHRCTNYLVGIRPRWASEVTRSTQQPRPECRT